MARQKKYSSAAVGFLKEKCPEKKKKAALSVFPSLPSSTAENRRKSKFMFEMHADHTNISKYSDGNIYRQFPVYSSPVLQMPFAHPLWDNG